MKKRADGLYKRSITINGKRKYFYGHSPAEVNKKIVKIKDIQENGRMFGEVADEWYKQHSKNVEYYTADGYRAPLKDVKKEFESYRVTDIKPLAVKTFIDNYNKKGLAQQTVKLRLIVLRLIFDYLILNNELEYNPTYSIKTPKSKKPTVKVKSISDDQLKKIDNNIDRPFGLLAFFIAYTGCRREEALAIKWEDVDFQNKLINISKVVIFKNNIPHVEDRAKSRAGIRKIIIRDKLLKVLSERSRRSGYIFQGKHGLLTLSELTDGWKSYLKAIDTQFTILQLRHTFSTALYEAGVDPKAGIAQTGHSNTSILENTYQEIRDKQYKIIAQKMNDYDKNRDE
jgi:integrase